MTTKEFEHLAKSEVIRVMKEKCSLELTEDELEFVWFSHELGYKKCPLYAKRLGHYYPEVTYNLAKNELYVDVYIKYCNVKVELSPKAKELS